MKAIIRTRPLYLVLMSLFFVFHGYVENFDFIPVPDALLLFFLYAVASTFVAALFWIIYRNLSKASFLAFLAIGFYFFFGYIYDVIDNLAPRSLFSKFSVILMILASILLFFFIFLLRYRGRLFRLNYGLNVFFLCLLLVDTVWLIGREAGSRVASDSLWTKEFTVCDSCSRPDIYLIVADEYGGERELRETMGYDNNAFRKEMEKRGFYLPTSSSNYNYTPFSISSMLQMNYLLHIEGSNTSHKDLSACYDQIRENRVDQFLRRYGYELHNYSIFDMHDQPSLVKESVLPERTRFITAQTLLSRLNNNILFNMAGRLGAKEIRKRLYMAYNSNVKVLDSTRAVVRKTGTPKFVYSHLVMPHFPYYFDRNGKEKPLSELAEGKEKDLNSYLDYLEYTNHVLLDLIDTIQHSSAHPPIIILMSDHGFREFSGTREPKYFFMNILFLNIPQKNYSGFYEGISNVNLFRVLFNQQFHQHFPLLPDSTIFLRP
ncbi:MAG: sulfatase-like hydrolase/transferase [Flavisolibacter sp.]